MVSGVTIVFQGYTTMFSIVWVSRAIYYYVFYRLGFLSYGLPFHRYISHRLAAKGWWLGRVGVRCYLFWSRVSASFDWYLDFFGLMDYMCLLGFHWEVYKVRYTTSYYKYLEMLISI